MDCVASSCVRLGSLLPSRSALRVEERDLDVKTVHRPAAARKCEKGLRRAPAVYILCLHTYPGRGSGGEGDGGGHAVKASARGRRERGSDSPALRPAPAPIGPQASTFAGRAVRRPAKPAARLVVLRSGRCVFFFGKKNSGRSENKGPKPIFEAPVCVLKLC